MRNLLIIFTFFIATSAFSQENVSVAGNKVTAREIAPVWQGWKGIQAQKKQCFQKKLVQHIKEKL